MSWTSLSSEIEVSRSFLPWGFLKKTKEKENNNLEVVIWGKEAVLRRLQVTRGLNERD